MTHSPWPVGALRDIRSPAAEIPTRLDVAYFHAETRALSGAGWCRYQYGVDYNSTGERIRALDHLRKTVTETMAKRGHDYVEWILLPGGEM